jgi:hypothetical protein
MDQGWRSVSFSAGEARALLLLLGRAGEFCGEYAAKNLGRIREDIEEALLQLTNTNEESI